jgi:hypothetical protein
MHARLRLANPEISFDPGRAYKLLQGVATPRNPGIYQDLAVALGLSQSGEVVRTCSFDAFAAMLAERAGPDAQSGADRDDRAEAGPRSSVDLSGLDGGYLLYIPSISRFPTPQVYRCMGRIATDAAGRTEMRLDAPRPGYVISARGLLHYGDRIVAGLLQSPEYGTMISLWFNQSVPGPCLHPDCPAHPGLRLGAVGRKIRERADRDDRGAPGGRRAGRSRAGLSSSHGEGGTLRATSAAGGISRRSMVARERSPLAGPVEVDEGYRGHNYAGAD